MARPKKPEKNDSNAKDHQAESKPRKTTRVNPLERNPLLRYAPSPEELKDLIIDSPPVKAQDGSPDRNSTGADKDALLVGTSPSTSTEKSPDSDYRDSFAEKGTNDLEAALETVTDERDQAQDELKRLIEELNRLRKENESLKSAGTEASRSQPPSPETFWGIDKARFDRSQIPSILMMTGDLDDMRVHITKDLAKSLRELSVEIQLLSGHQVEKSRMGHVALSLLLALRNISPYYHERFKKYLVERVNAGDEFNQRRVSDYWIDFNEKIVKEAFLALQKLQEIGISRPLIDSDHK